MSQPVTAAELPAALCRLPVDKPGVAVEFLRQRGAGVMDLIAHFWEGLARTPPLQRGDLHLVVAFSPGYADYNTHIDEKSCTDDSRRLAGAMLYVPKAHCADVLALDPATAGAFAAYIAQVGVVPPELGIPEAEGRDAGVSNAAGGNGGGNGGSAEDHVKGRTATRAAIDFLTGGASGVQAMIPHLLPLVHKRAPVKQSVNVVMQLPAEVAAASDPAVRLARDADAAVLTRWRKMYREERGILFDADMDAMIQAQRVFVQEEAAPSGNGAGAAAGNIVAVGKFDLELARLVEIGGVFTFPEYRKRGYGARIVGDLASRIRVLGKVPTLQVDQDNVPAVRLYEKLGWKRMGELARVWLTG